jgi:hypothetical protein
MTSSFYLRSVGRLAQKYIEKGGTSFLKRNEVPDREVSLDVSAQAVPFGP